MKTVLTMLTTSLMLSAAYAHDMHSSKQALDALDPDKDGSITWTEVKPSVIAHWHSLTDEKAATSSEKNTHESTKKVESILSAEKAKHVNPDHDGSLSLSEYLAVAHYRFRHADKEHDGSLDAKEIDSADGKDMLRMMQNPNH